MLRNGDARAPGRFRPGTRGTRGVSYYEGTDMSAGEKSKAKTEQIVGKAVRKVAHAVGDDTTAAKGAALETRGKGRDTKEKAKGAFKR